MRFRWLFTCAVPALLAQSEPPRVIEVLQANCSGCHGNAMQMSGLRLDSRDALLRGGSKGPAIVSGNAAQSRLFQLVSHTGQPAMPPGKKLPPADLEAIRTWIDAGAPWPAALASKSGGSGAPKPVWWSFRPPVRPEPPAVAGASAIDRFINAKLAVKGLQPGGRATKLALVRRAYYDLHGLPPTFEQARKFVDDASPNAWEKLIDELLSSPRYGEKWGRYWLDLVRYGDTAGFEQDPYILDAWRYRDYVVESFNADKPYDRFVKEQIAGDELWPDDPQAQVGTGYFTVGTNRDMLFKVEDVNRVEQLTDYVDTTSSVFMGLTVGCARCHDHKFDPIPQRDYYRMQAIFVPAVKHRIFLNYNGARGYDIQLNYREFKLRDLGEEIETIQKPFREAIRKQKIAALPPDLRHAFETEDAKRTAAERVLVDSNPALVRVSQEEIYNALTPDEKARIDTLGRKLVGMFAGHSSGPIAPGIMDMDRIGPETFIPVRGQSGRGVLVKPGLLSALGGTDVPEPPADATSTMRRKALAEWLGNPQHPLTARVMINRIWQGHFGRGLVATPSDFGTRGSAPTHPELLDWLAAEFTGRGWSIKQMHKLIMLSDAYQRDSNVASQVRAKDPENLWLSHFARHRLAAEEVRDSVLQATGELNLKMGGRPVVPPQAKEELYGMSQSPDNFWPVSWNKQDHMRRSVYMLVRRSYRPPLMEAFDGPDGTLHCARRDESTVAPQSLTLLNSDFAYSRARTLAERLEKESDPARIVSAGYRQVLGREPSSREQKLTLEFLSKQQQRTGSLDAAVTEFARALFNLNEFLYVD